MPRHLIMLKLFETFFGFYRWKECCFDCFREAESNGQLGLVVTKYCRVSCLLLGDWCQNDIFNASCQPFFNFFALQGR